MGSMTSGTELNTATSGCLLENIFLLFLVVLCVPVETKLGFVGYFFPLGIHDSGQVLLLFINSSSVPACS